MVAGFHDHPFLDDVDDGGHQNDHRGRDAGQRAEGDPADAARRPVGAVRGQADKLLVILSLLGAGAVAAGDETRALLGDRSLNIFATLAHHPKLLKDTITHAQEEYKKMQISNQATQEQRQFALYWADDPGKTPTPAGHWAFIATDLLRTRKASLAEAGEVYARLNIAMADAFIAAWHTKYALNLLRPVTYVQLVIDSNWVPGLMATPPFPEFPSGHSVQSSTAAAVLAEAFGADTAFTDNTHNDRGWGPRNFKNFAAAADEAALSRLYAGIHFRAAIENGQVQGRCVAAKVLALKLQR